MNRQLPSTILAIPELLNDVQNIALNDSFIDPKEYAFISAEINEAKKHVKNIINFYEEIYEKPLTYYL